MKRTFIFFAPICFILNANAQPNMYISGGIKLIKPDSRTITLWYVDESPSMDNIYTEFRQSQNLAFEACFRYQDVSLDKQIHPYIELEGYLGGLNGIALTGGFCYVNHTSSRNTRIQPELGAILGYCSKGIGSIQNNDVYIKVNNTKFKDYTSVNVALSNVYLGIKPGLSLVNKVGFDNEIGIGVSYQLSVKFARVSFSGQDDNGNPVRDFENLNESNVGFYVEGEKTDQIPFNPDGFEFKVFYGF